MNKISIKSLLGFLLASLLLCFYVYTWGCMIVDVANYKGTENSTSGKFYASANEGFFYVASTVAGIAAALAIAILGATAPGKSPTAKSLVINVNDASEDKLIELVTLIFLLSWFGVGAFAVLYGVMGDKPLAYNPEVVKVDSDRIKADVRHAHIMSTYTYLAGYGTTWLGMAVSAVFVYLKLRPSSENKSILRTSVEEKLETKIDEGKIIFDGPSNVSARLKSELLRENSGQKITEDLQKLVLHLSEIVGTKIRISSLVRNSVNFKPVLQKHFNMFAGHPSGESVDIGNEEVAKDLLSQVANDAEVSRLKIDEIIFDAKISGEDDRNFWNYDGGEKHQYNSDTLDDHKDHIHFKVL